MATRIPYLDEVWNVTTGCGDDMVSPGCLNCYARRMFGRNLWKCPECHGMGEVFYLQDGYPDNQRACACPTCHGTGAQDFAPTFHADRLEQPLHWRKPRRVGVSFMGDLFHEAITDEQRDAVLARIIASPQHTFMLLTKRPEAARAYLSDQHERCAMLLANWHHLIPDGLNPWPLRNLHLGVTVCNQEEADRLVPLLLDTPAAVRWVSYEPALEAVDFTPWAPRADYWLLFDNLVGTCDWGGCNELAVTTRHSEEHGKLPVCASHADPPRLNWLVLGGETGPGARPMQPEWALDVYRQCRAAGVPFSWKDGGSWLKRHGAVLRGVDASDWGDMIATHELPAALAGAVRT